MYNLSIHYKQIRFNLTPITSQLYNFKNDTKCNRASQIAGYEVIYVKNPVISIYFNEYKFVLGVCQTDRTVRGRVRSLFFQQ